MEGKWRALEVPWHSMKYKRQDSGTQHAVGGMLPSVHAVYVGSVGVTHGWVLTSFFFLNLRHVCFSVW